MVVIVVSKRSGAVFFFCLPTVGTELIQSLRRFSQLVTECLGGNFMIKDLFYCVKKSI